MTTKDFKKGDHVLYLPLRAKGNPDHRDCESGVVSFTNESFVFVKYDNAVMKMKTGDEPYTAQATEADMLIKIK